MKNKKLAYVCDFSKKMLTFAECLFYSSEVFYTS